MPESPRPWPRAMKLRLWHILAAMAGLFLHGHVARRTVIHVQHDLETSPHNLLRLAREFLGLVQGRLAQAGYVLPPGQVYMLPAIQAAYLQEADSDSEDDFEALLPRFALCLSGHLSHPFVKCVA